MVSKVPRNGTIQNLFLVPNIPQNHAVGAGNKEEIKEYVMKLDKTMVTEFNDILIVCFTLRMPGNNILVKRPPYILFVNLT